MKYTASKAVVLGYQEMKMVANRTALKNALLCASCTYNGYVTDYTTNNWTSAALPIVWKRSDFTLVSSGNKVAVPSYDTSNKYLTWVKLRHNATKKEFYLVNAHPVYGAAKNDGTRSGDTVRENAYREYMDSLVSKLNELKGANIPIFVTGDFNIDFRKDRVVKDSMFPYRRLGAIGFRSNWDVLNLSGVGSTQGTTSYGSIIFDYIYFWQRSDTKANVEWISSYFYGSDHHLITTNFTVTR